MEDIAELSKRAVVLATEEQAIVAKGLRTIPATDGRVYIAIHGEGTSFIVYHNGVPKEFSHRSLAKYISSNSDLNGKDIVLLSCSNTTSAQNLANKLGNNRKVIAWEGEVEVFENGYIRGKGACKEFSSSTNGQPNTRTLTTAETPKGRNELPALTGTNRTPRVVLDGSMPAGLASTLDRFFIGNVSALDYVRNIVNQTPPPVFAAGSKAKFYEEINNLIGKKPIIDMTEAPHNRFLIRLESPSTNIAVSIEKNSQGHYIVNKYARAYKPEANPNIRVALSRGKTAPDYAIPVQGAPSYMFQGLNNAPIPAGLVDGSATAVGAITKVSNNNGMGLSMDLILTGSNKNDFKALNEAAEKIARENGNTALADAFKEARITGRALEINGVPYTWHHLDNFDPSTGKCTVQLVQTTAHNSTAELGVKGMAHSGGAAQYRAYNGNSFYND